MFDPVTPTPIAFTDGKELTSGSAQQFLDTYWDHKKKNKYI